MKKATLHMGKQGASKHNDRKFDLEKAEHINPQLTQFNKYIFLQGNGKYNEMSFEEMEIDYYREHYGEALNEQNRKAKENRQKDRIKDMTYWVKEDKQKKPDEMILQIGNKENHIDKDTLMLCIKDFCEKVNKKYGSNFHMLNLALHVDEPDGTPHIHLRGVFDYEENGMRKIGTDKALKEMGIEPPKPNEKIGRYNNRKQTFTAEIRSLWHDIIKSHGIEIDEEVKNPSAKHLETQNYKIEQNNKTIKEQEEQIRNNDIVINGKKYKEILDELVESLKDTFETSKDRTIKQLAKNVYDNLRISYKEKGLKSYEELKDRPTEELSL